MSRFLLHKSLAAHFVPMIRIARRHYGSWRLDFHTALATRMIFQKLDNDHGTAIVWSQTSLPGKVCSVTGKVCSAWTM
jgi:hypothetical protein